MSYSQAGDRVRLEMTREQYESLLLMMGSALATCRDRERFWHWVQVANELNAGNPHFTPYEIPEELRGPKEEKPNVQLELARRLGEL